MSKELITSRFYNDASLVALYRFNSGALTTDSKGSYTLTNTNTVAETSAGKFGYGADYGSGVNNRMLSVASNLGIAGDGDVTISSWVNPATTPNATYPILTLQSFSSTTNTDRFLAFYYQYFSSTVELRVYAGVYPFPANTSYTITLENGAWYHSVVTRTGTTYNAYLNGKKIIGPVTITHQNGWAGNGFAIGNGVGGSGQGWQGKQDDVAVFSRVLSDNEVYELYHDLTFKFRPGSLGSMLWV